MHARIAAALAALAVLAAGCGRLNVGPLAAAAPRVQADRYVLRLADLPSGWKQAAHGKTSSASADKAGAEAAGCLGDNANRHGVEDNSRGVDSPDFKSPNGHEVLSSSVTIPSSGADVHAFFGVLRGKPFQSCLAKVIGAAFAAGDGGFKATLAKSEMVPIPSPLPDAIDDRMTLKYTDAGATGTIFVDLVTEGTGHAVVSIALVDVVVPGDIPTPDNGTLAQVADAVGRRILGQ